SDDYAAFGNIESAYGRIARRQGRFDRAIVHFNRSIEEYRRRDPEHPNIARSQINTVAVKRLISVQIQRRLDHETARRKAEKSRETQATNTLAADRARMEALRAEARADLYHAGALYEKSENPRGRGA